MNVVSDRVTRVKTQLKIVCLKKKKIVLNKLIYFSLLVYF